MNTEIKDLLIRNGWLKNVKNITLLAGDASSRRYYRIFDGLKTYILCEDKILTEKKAAHNFLRMQCLLLENQVLVPSVLETDFESGYLLQSDLGDITLLSHISTMCTNDVLRLYQSTLSSQLKINCIKPNSINNKEEAFVLKFDSTKLMQEMDLTIKHFLKSYLELGDNKLTDDLRLDLISLTQTISTLPTCLVHRDFHSRNLMVLNNEIYVIDFQDARQGIPQYDLVSLLDDCYFRLSTDAKQFLQQKYYEMARRENLINENYDDFQRHYRLMKIQRTLKAIGSFCFINDTKKNNRYLKYVGFAFNNLKDDLLQMSEYKSFKKLVQIYYEK